MIGNGILLGAWQLLTVASVPKKKIRSNTAENMHILQRESGGSAMYGVFEPGRYIENQPQLGMLKFGRGFDFAYGGCSVIAVYNTLLSLGERMSAETLCGIAEELQRRGVALGGRFGVAPLSLKYYLKRRLEPQGFTVKSTVSIRVDVLDAIGAESDAILVVLWNGKKLKDQFHAMHIEKREGRFIIHNACYLIKTDNDGGAEVQEQPGNLMQPECAVQREDAMWRENAIQQESMMQRERIPGKYGEMGPYETLSAAIGGYGRGSAKAALTIGIKKQ